MPITAKAKRAPYPLEIALDTLLGELIWHRRQCEPRSKLVDLRKEHALIDKALRDAMRKVAKLLASRISYEAVCEIVERTAHSCGGGYEGEVGQRYAALSSAFNECRTCEGAIWLK